MSVLGCRVLCALVTCVTIFLVCSVAQIRLEVILTCWEQFLAISVAWRGYNEWFCSLCEWRYKPLSNPLMKFVNKIQSRLHWNCWVLLGLLLWLKYHDAWYSDQHSLITESHRIENVAVYLNFLDLNQSEHLQDKKFTDLCSSLISETWFAPTRGGLRQAVVGSIALLLKFVSSLEQMSAKQA